ncbi:YetF domain-containing protein [Oceanobacillus longus]|uniref:YetF domain-containing protein n=1 Tax=Oceanobacillus longus TaxID=930120 RepID=A0ABV8H0S3_9BACI
MSGYISMFFETIFGFFALFLITKILGKSQINQITPFDFISALLLGELVGNALFDEKAGIPEIAFVVTVYGILLYSTEIITQKFKGTRHLIEGSPAIVIYNGKLIRDTMKKNKLDVNQLQHLLRAKDIFSLQEVEFGILEANGTISVLKKSDYQTPSRKDMKLSPHDVSLPTTLVNDGEIIYDNLKEKNLTEEWLIEKLKEQGYDHLEEIFYVEYVKNTDLLVHPILNRNHQRWDLD